MRAYVSVCMCVCACMRACVRACVQAGALVCVCARGSGVPGIQNYVHILFLTFYVNILVDFVEEEKKKKKKSVITLVGEMQRNRNERN